MLKKSIAFFSLLLCISISSQANSANLFSYDETAIEQQLTVASNAEAEFSANEQNATFIKEKNKLVSLVNKSSADASIPDVGFLSFAAGCCLGLPGVAVVSLHYYYQSGNIAAGRESLKIGIIGVVVRTVATIAIYYYLLTEGGGFGI